MKTCSQLIFATLLLFTCSISSFAFNDLDNLLDNSDITWAAEVYVDYAPTVNHFTIKKKEMIAKYGLSKNTFVTLKTLQDLTDAPIRIDPVSLAKQVLEMSPDTKSTFFKDANLKETLSYADYQKIIQGKTPFVIESDENVETEHKFRYKISPYQIPLFRVKQILHYNEKTNELSLTPIAIAPVFCIYNKKQELTGRIPLFWMPIKDLNQAIDLSSNAINWAKRMTRSIHSEEVKVIKGKETLADILTTICNRYAEAPKLGKLYYTYGKMEAMSLDEIKNINNSIDTIITFNPDTFEEIVSVTKVEVNPKTTNKLRIIQDWVWNKETQRINIKLVAFAPIVKHFDNAGNFLHSGPLFYKKENE